MTKTLFQRIWDKEIPSYELYRYSPGNGLGFVAILDIFPATPGHTLVISENPVEGWMDLSKTERRQADELTTIVGQHVATLLRPAGIVRATFGDQIKHFHNQVIPTFERGDVIRRMHPDSGRMDAPADKDFLGDMHQFLRFDSELATHTDLELSTLATRQ